MTKDKHSNMELYLSQIIRKNLTIRSLSIMLGDMVTTLEHDKELVAYTAHFEEIQTLLDCILDESNRNDEDLDKVQHYFEQLTSKQKGGVA